MIVWVTNNGEPTIFIKSKSGLAYERIIRCILGEEVPICNIKNTNRFLSSIKNFWNKGLRINLLYWIDKRDYKQLSAQRYNTIGYTWDLKRELTFPKNSYKPLNIHACAKRQNIIDIGVIMGEWL